MIVLDAPHWLLLGVPLLVFVRLRPMPSRLLAGLRLALLALLLLALSRPSLRLPARSGMLVVVADRSASMPPASAGQQLELVRLAREAMGRDPLLGVVAFGRQAVVEHAPQRGPFAGFAATLDDRQSNLAGALDLALALIPPDNPGRLLVLSDGRWTGLSPERAAWRAAARGVAIDYRVMERPLAGDTAVRRLAVPQRLQPGETVLIHAWIDSPVSQEAEILLTGDGQPLAAGRHALHAGVNRLTFRDLARDPGTQRYRLEVRSALEDPVPENNQARALLSVQGARPLLCVTPNGRSGLVQLLRRGGIETREVAAAGSRWSLDDLAGCAAVVIENVSASQIGRGGLETLAAWVREGGGLLLTGGRNAFGAGGYFQSPLDPLLPVSLEQRREHRKFDLAMVLALDRSGSMALSAGGGRTKMDLANLGAVQVLDLLADGDEYGVVAVDSAPHIILPLAAAEAQRERRDRILGIRSEGGGIFVHEALVAASRMLLASKAQTRHIVLFADAADAEEPGDYAALLEKCRAANLSVSVVGLGTPVDVDAQLLREIARCGGGACYFTDTPEELPRLFAQDTFAVMRSAFLEEQTPFALSAGFSLLAPPPPGRPPPLGGYNLCYARPEANLAAITGDEFAAPVVASRHVGAGRVAVFTGEADGAFAGPFAAWSGAGDFYASLARWSAGEAGELPGHLLLRQQIEGDALRVTLDIDPAFADEAPAQPPQLTLLRGEAGQPPVSERLRLSWESADRLAVTIPLSGGETVLPTLHLEGLPAVPLSPACLPYAPEFNPPAADRGRPALERLAAASGGRERLDISARQAPQPPRPRRVELASTAYLLALLLFLLEVLQRRTGLLDGLPVPRLPHSLAVHLRRPSRGTPTPRSAPSAPAAASSASAPAPAAAAPPPPAAAGTLDALRRASRQARSRTRR